jgi:hypothetical protein
MKILTKNKKNKVKTHNKNSKRISLFELQNSPKTLLFKVRV